MVCCNMEPVVLPEKKQDKPWKTYPCGDPALMTEFKWIERVPVASGNETGVAMGDPVAPLSGEALKPRAFVCA
eukprot:3398530-Amphidinium_carterae.1